MVPVVYWRRCVVCGREFFGRSDRTLACSARCNARRWRAVGMLAGTHGYVGGQFKRLRR
jgi:hypothetical protein